MNCIKNADVYIENEGVKKCDLVFDEKTLGFDASGVEAAELVLPGGAVVLPAFIDEHIHGAAGCDFSDGGDATERIAEALPKEGTAYFLATTMTVERKKLIAALEAFKKYFSAGAFDVAEPLGVHLEGPFISEKHIGAQNPKGLERPDAAYLNELVEASGGSVRLITLAPENPGATELIKAAVERGIRVSIGHTDATADEVYKAASVGATGATHLFNAMRGIHHREIGTAGAALMDDSMYVELIADGVHVSADAMRLVKRIKPRGKIVFITDAIRAKGVGDGVSSLGGQTVYVKNGEARLSDGTLAGSVLTMNTAFKNAVELLGASVEEASDYCSKNPAARLGLGGELGGIKKGKRASYTVIGKDRGVIATVRDGKVIYNGQGEKLWRA